MLLGGFAKFRKAIIGFVMYVCPAVRPSVRPSVRMQQISAHLTDFHEIWCMIFRKPVEKIQVSLKSDKNNGYFA
jgi:hypothetical protein